MHDRMWSFLGRWSSAFVTLRYSFPFLVPGAVFAFAVWAALPRGPGFPLKRFTFALALAFTFGFSFAVRCSDGSGCGNDVVGQVRPHSLRRLHDLPAFHGGGGSWRPAVA